tara:strand:- start:165 stop:269 length:105 start_codon:yes stop_codon:yes gene_type:complete
MQHEPAFIEKIGVSVLGFIAAIIRFSAVYMKQLL